MKRITEPEHTPGPWLAVPTDGERDSWKVIDAKDHFVIALMVDEEDAPLIAAAPDLLEACKSAFKLPRPWMDGGVTFEEWDAAIDRIEKAIRKAEGK